MSSPHTTPTGAQEAIVSTRRNPPGWLRAVGGGVIIVAVGAAALVVTDPERPPLLGLILLILLLLFVAGIGISLILSPVRAVVTSDSVTARYGPFHHSVALADVTEVVQGDQIDGVGYGFGVRWEGKGRWAYRLGGPMVTIVHTGGRLGISVPDAAAFMTDLERVRGQGGHDRPVPSA